MTKQQRKEIYWAAMFRIHEVGLANEGLCYLINMMQIRHATILIEYDLPELWAQKPSNPYNGRFWFRPGSNKRNRLKALSAAIDLCEK